jgi:hypothetical protein
VGQSLRRKQDGYAHLPELVRNSSRTITAGPGYEFFIQDIHKLHWQPRRSCQADRLSNRSPTFQPPSNRT